MAYLQGLLDSRESLGCSHKLILALISPLNDNELLDCCYLGTYFDVDAIGVRDASTADDIAQDTVKSILLANFECFGFSHVPYMKTKGYILYNLRSLVL